MVWTDFCICTCYMILTNVCLRARRVSMVMPSALALITFPAVLSWAQSGLQEAQWLAYACHLIEMRLNRLLRFQHGEVYSVSVGQSFGAASPAPADKLRGEVSITFSCNPTSTDKLIELALTEMEQLQVSESRLDQVVHAVDYTECS